MQKIKKVEKSFGGLPLFFFILYFCGLKYIFYE
nr:MAG TPA: hypothetical protein [Caudoviricetes sp.]